MTIRIKIIICLLFVVFFLFGAYTALALEWNTFHVPHPTPSLREQHGCSTDAVFDTQTTQISKETWLRM
jgi:hypothetical protein